MQIISLNSISNNTAQVVFTSVLAANLQTRISNATLAHGSIGVKVFKGGAATAVTPVGATGTVTTSWLAEDDTNGVGVRRFLPAAADLVLGICTFIFTGTNMEPREVDVEVVAYNPYDTVRLGLTALRPDAVLIGAVVAGTLTANAFTTNLTIPNGQLANEAHLRFLGNVTATLAGQVQKITGYTGTVPSFAAGFSVAPAIGDLFVVVNG